jgi:tetrahydrodipicolinate N-succinyltransferase
MGDATIREGVAMTKTAAIAMRSFVNMGGVILDG